MESLARPAAPAVPPAEVLGLLGIVPAPVLGVAARVPRRDRFPTAERTLAWTVGLGLRPLSILATAVRQP